MPNAPFFSVVVPVYNKGPHLHRCITSVLRQTFKDFELLMVNDASTDNSLEEIQRFSDPRLRILHRNQPGPGGYAARNLGIQGAKGRWIAFLDADDEWFPEHLRQMAALAARFPACALTSCGWRVVDLHGRGHEDAFFRYRRNSDSTSMSLEEYLALCIRDMRPACSSVVCVRNDQAAEGMFPSELARRGGDQYAWLLYLAKAKKMAWSPHLGATYYRDSVNMVTRTEQLDPATIKSFEKNLLRLVESHLIPLVQRYHNRFVWHCWRSRALSPTCNTFPLAAYLSWRTDLVFCTIRSMIAIAPPQLFRGAYRALQAWHELAERRLVVRKRMKALHQSAGATLEN